MARPPVLDGSMLVGGVVVQDGVGRPADLVEKCDEFLVPVVLGVVALTFPSKTYKAVNKVVVPFRPKGKELA